MNEMQTAAESIANALVDAPKGLSMKVVKRLTGTALGIQRVRQVRLLPVLELGKELELFSVKGNRVVAYAFDVPVARYTLMSREAQAYYATAMKVSPVYVNQAERYLDYCEKCKAKGIDPVHPKQWVCGDVE